MLTPSFIEANQIGVSVIIPCYQSELTLAQVVHELHSEFQQNGLVKFEILMVLDGPTDGTKDIATKLASQFSECRIIELSRNFGQHAAIYAGIYSSKHGLIVTMDDDGQHPPSAIPALFTALSPEVDIVYGVSPEEEHGVLRSFASRQFKIALFRVLGIRNARDISAVRLFRKSLLNNVDLRQLSVGVIDVALHWNTSRIVTIPLQMSKRYQGRSNYNFRSLVRFAIQMLVSFSIKPLKFALFLGVLTFCFSSVLTIHYLYQYFTGRVEVAGFTTLTILIATLSSIQLITLGILGEYLGSIHQRSMGKPLFNIKES